MIGFYLLFHVLKVQDLLHCHPHPGYVYLGLQYLDPLQSPGVSCSSLYFWSVTAAFEADPTRLWKQTQDGGGWWWWWRLLPLRPGQEEQRAGCTAPQRDPRGSVSFGAVGVVTARQ